jgi:hypothetical protein
MTAALLAGCGALSNVMSSASSTTTVKAVWKDPKYSAAPMKKIFVISLMKTEPGGRDAVEDAIVAQLQRAGVEATASHTLMPSDPMQPQPALMDIITRSGADGVLMARVKWMSAEEPYTIGGTLTSPAPDMLGFSDFLASEGANQPGDFKVARISTSIFQGSLGKQVWTAYTDSYNAGNLARIIPDYTAKVVTALAQDRIIAATSVKF